MPVTAKLSRRFYEKFGDEIVNELVEWLNQVDLSYRSELRETNELNFARFDSKQEQLRRGPSLQDGSVAACAPRLGDDRSTHPGDRPCCTEPPGR